VNYSRALVNYSRALVNSRAIVNSGAVVNSETVGTDSTDSNRGVVVIIDSLDVFNDDPPIIENGVEFYELPALFSINMVTGLTAGNHFIVPGTFLTELSSNFDVSYGTGTLNVLKDTLTVGTKSSEIVYGSAQPIYAAEVSGFKYDDTFASVIKSIQYNLKDANGNLKPSTGVIPAGTYQIVPVVELITTELRPGEPVNYVLKFSYGTLTVKPSSLTVKADDKLILSGETPTFTSTYVGLIPGDTPTAGPLYTTNPPYNGLAGVYSIIPSNVEFASGSNYEIEYLNGVLYVNPSGNSAKAIRPVLRCVEEVKNNPNYTLRARFEYQNDNASAVFIPIGPENMIVSEGSYSGVQPELFLPGGGSFEILFTGARLTWTVVSYEKDKKTSVGSTASSTSTRCKKGNSTGREETEAAAYMEPIAPEGETLVGYPNPAGESISVVLPGLNESPTSSDVVVLDQFGRPYSVKTTWSPEDNALVLDFSSIERGLYIIKINFSEGIKLLKVYKQ
jgi:hypothetical protein